jgi:hypothetical protein
VRDDNQEATRESSCERTGTALIFLLLVERFVFLGGLFSLPGSVSRRIDLGLLLLSLLGSVGRRIRSLGTSLSRSFVFVDGGRVGGRLRSLFGLGSLVRRLLGLRGRFDRLGRVSSVGCFRNSHDDRVQKR